MQGVSGTAAPTAEAPSRVGASADLPTPISAIGALRSLSAVARFHHIAADPATLAHQLGCSPHEAADAALLLRAAKHLGLKARLTRTTVDRLASTPLPALALLRSDAGEIRFVILAQCDAQRVLLQDPSSPSSRPVIEPLDVL